MIFIPLACLLLLLGCTAGHSSASQEKLLLNNQWKVVELAGKNIEQPKQTAAIYIRFSAADSKIDGFGGCNRITGAYQLNNQQLTFVQIALTRKYCKNDMELEAQFVKALRNTTLYKIEENSLTLLQGTSRLAVLKM